MPRMISEQEKRKKREAALRARRVANLTAKGWSETDAMITVNALSSAKELALLGRLARQLGQPAQARSLDLLALDVAQPAVHLAEKNGVPLAGRIAEALDRKRAAYGAPLRGRVIEHG